MKRIFSEEFCRKLLTTYEKEIESFEANEYYVKMFCDANAILLSNFMREIIYEALDQYRTFFNRFLTKPIREVKDIIEGERLNPLYYDFEDTFLTVKLQESENKAAYSDNPKLIKENLLRILDELVKVSQQIARPENTLRKSDKPFLPEVTFEDKRYKETLSYLSPKLEELLQPLKNLLVDFVPYEKYLHMNAATFLKGSPTIKAVKEEFVRLEELTQHVDTMPFFCCARLVEIDFRELKAELESRLESYRDQIIKWAHENILRNSSELERGVIATFDFIKQKPETTEKLIEIEQYIAKVRKETEKKYRLDFDELKKWLFYLYSLDVRFTTEEYVQINKAAMLLFSMPQKVSEEENRIEDEKLRLEDLTNGMRNQLNADIAQLISDIQSLRDFNDQFDQKKANDKIDMLKEKIKELNQTMAKINRDEELLQLSSISEFPKLEEAAAILQPYQKLWWLARNFETNNASWVKSSIFKLDPELMKK